VVTTPADTPARPSRERPLDLAYEVCARFARDHYENFPVASRLLPAAMRPHVAAVYAFARIADDFADEGETPEARRLEFLEDWDAWLHAGEGRAGTPPHPSTPTAARALPRTSRPCDTGGANLPGDGLPSETPEVFAALRATIRTCDLPLSLFEDLLSAFRQDVTTRRYVSWPDVFDYCRRSANPVGRLVLRIAGYRDEALDRSSDALCTALQLTNFWQDLERDWAKGRLYVPLDDCRRAGAQFEDLDAHRMSGAWRDVLRRAGTLTAEMFGEGRVVCNRVPGRLGLELRLTWLGGRRILERLQQADFDVFGRRPTLGPADLPVLLWRLATWRRA
jgi:hydroxysqualene synthase